MRTTARQQISGISIWYLSLTGGSHLTRFAQEVYRVVCFQEGRHREAVEERQITVCVSLCLQQNRLVSHELLFTVTDCDSIVFESKISDWSEATMCKPDI